MADDGNFLHFLQSAAICKALVGPRLTVLPQARATASVPVWMLVHPWHV
jgi:hypothetical protein